VLAGALACATNPVSEQLKQGRYAEAAGLCGSHPPEGSTRRLCDEATARLAAPHLAAIANLRARHVESSAVEILAEIDAALRMLAEHPLPPESASARQVARDLQLARESMQADLEAMAARPLAAQSYLATRAPFLGRPPLRGWLLEAQSSIGPAGRASCRRLRANAASDVPSWGELVDRYCDRFGMHVATDRPTQRRLDVAFQADGIDSDAAQVLRKVLEQRLAATYWLQSYEPIELHAAVTGTYEARIDDQTVVLHESYVDQRMAYPLIPRAGVTVVPLSVDFPYEATDHRGRYDANLKLTVAFSDGSPPLELRLRKTESLHGRDHNVTFERANVHPVHQHISSPDSWLQLEFEPFVENLREALNQRWVASHCQASEYSLETAAGCALAGQTPALALAVIEAALADDGLALAHLASRALDRQTPGTGRSQVQSAR